MEFITKSPHETQEVGRRFANSVIERGDKNFIGALTGGLGSGKTTFVQGFANGLGIVQRIISPTFILVRRYDITKRSSGFENFYHIDLYRLEDPSQIRDLGITDIWKRRGNLLLIEWAERIKDVIPKEACWINFEDLGGEKRRIKVE